MRRLFGLIGAVALTGWAQAAGPASISANDRAQGARAHPQLLDEFGGAYTGPQAQYVRRVGQRIAVQSGLSNAGADFTITLLNSPVNNAFAVPGGYVYITRQLAALANDEAELASVMGHEVGHVAARHANKRSTRSTGAGILSVLLGAVTGSSQIAQLASQAAQLYTLRFSRQQEYEADDLGIQYLTRAGYDPLASSRLLASLAAQSALDSRMQNESGRTLPEWASTHPDPASRVQRAAQRGAATGRQGGEVNRDGFLAAIDGVLVDDDPRQGVIDGQSFRHPELRVAFTGPNGFTMQNGTQAVTVSGSGGQAQFTAAPFSGSLEQYVERAFAALGGQAALPVGELRRARINGLDTAYATARANTRSGAVDATVFAYAFDSTRAYHFVIITPAGRGLGPFQPMIGSVRRLSAAEATQIRPRRIDVVTVRPGDTVQNLAARMAYPSLRYERFMTLNALRPNRPLVPGQRVKLVVYG